MPLTEKTQLPRRATLWSPPLSAKLSVDLRQGSERSLRGVREPGAGRLTRAWMGALDAH